MKCRLNIISAGVLDFTFIEECGKQSESCVLIIRVIKAVNTLHSPSRSGHYTLIIYPVGTRPRQVSGPRMRSAHPHPPARQVQVSGCDDGRKIVQSTPSLNEPLPHIGHVSKSLWSPLP